MTQRSRTRCHQWSASSLAVLTLLLSVFVAGPAQARAGAETGTAVRAADTAFAASVAAAGTTGTLAVVVAPLQTAEGAVALADRTSSPVANGLAAEPFYTASLAKLFVVEDVLHRARTGALTLTTADRQLLMSMLVSSDDPAMSTAWDRWGGAQMVSAVAARYGLTGTTGPAVPGQWGETVTTASDTARFLSALSVTADPADATTIRFWLALASPAGADGFDQTFGLMAPGLTGPVAAKQGWMCCVDGARDLHSVGVVDGEVVVLLSRTPTGAGWDTGRAAIDAAAEALLG